MFNTTAKRNTCGLVPGREYTVYAVVPNGYDMHANFLVTVDGDYRLVSSENFTAITITKW